MLTEKQGRAERIVPGSQEEWLFSIMYSNPVWQEASSESCVISPLQPLLFSFLLILQCGPEANIWFLMGWLQCMILVAKYFRLY